MTDFHVSDALGKRIQSLIQKHVNHHPLSGGRKRVEDRTVFNAILFVARTGCQWNALNAIGISSSSTALPCYRTVSVQFIRFVTLMMKTRTA